MGLLEAPPPSGEAAAATLVGVLVHAGWPRPPQAPGVAPGLRWAARQESTVPALPPNPLMQLTNADGARLRPPAALRWRAVDLRFSQVVCN
jgi:hypothetical protein